MGGGKWQKEECKRKEEEESDRRKTVRGRKKRKVAEVRGRRKRKLGEGSLLGGRENEVMSQKKE